MALVIDGYNLLHASGILPRGVGPGTLERARAALLNFLVESLEADELAKAVVVFDARAAPKGRPRLVTHRGLRVHFAPNPGDADALIEQLILDDHSPRKLIVVSSDHRLQRAARRRRAQSIDSDRWYAEVLQRRMGRQQRADEDASKPAGPLSDHEVARWLSQFGMTPIEGESAEQAISGQESPKAADPAEPHPGQTGARKTGTGKTGARQVDAGPADADKRGAKTSRKKPPARGNLANPFPPGYGEDLLEDL
jgi:predicted RNA-binding protein with PIN domain